MYALCILLQIYYLLNKHSLDFLDFLALVKIYKFILLLG